MSQQPTIPYSESNYHQQQQQQVPPSSPHFSSGPYDMENWEHRWRRKTSYDAQGRLIGTAIEEEATYTPPHLLQLQPTERQRGGKGLLWLLLLFLLAPVAFPLIIIGFLVLSVVLAVLQKVILTIIMVVTGLLVLLLLFRLVGRMARRP